MNGGLIDLYGSSSSAGENQWTTMDMTGDRKPDLVLTSLGNEQFGVMGERFWRVFVAAP
jgi:hypothetical protein